MLSALGHVLPVAVAMALSTIPIMATVVILLSPRRTVSAVPFATGWVIGLAGVSTGAVLFGRSLPAAREHGQAPVVGTVEIVIGAALVVLAVASWRRSRVASPVVRVRTGWLARVGSLGPLACFGVGVALNLRPKGLLLGLAAGLAAADGTAGPVEAVVVLAVYLVIAASTVVGPVVATLVAPARMEPSLRSVEDWLGANRAVVTGLIMLLVGVVVLGNGLTRF